MRKVLAHAAPVFQHFAHVRVDVGGEGFVFEKAVDEAHERERALPGVVNARRGVQRELPRFGRLLDEPAVEQVVKATLDVRRPAHQFESAQRRVGQRHRPFGDDARAGFDQQVAVRLDNVEVLDPVGIEIRGMRQPRRRQHLEQK